jgi:hypothetical protein
MTNKTKNTNDRSSEGRYTTNDGKCIHKYKRGTNGTIEMNEECFVIRKKK